MCVLFIGEKDFEYGLGLGAGEGKGLGRIGWGKMNSNFNLEIFRVCCHV